MLLVLFGRKKPPPKVRHWTWRLAWRERMENILYIVDGYLAGAESGQPMVNVATDDLVTIQSDVIRAREIIAKYAK
jgi:hypothetical protein